LICIFWNCFVRLKLWSLLVCEFRNKAAKSKAKVGRDYLIICLFLLSARPSILLNSKPGHLRKFSQVSYRIYSRLTEENLRPGLWIPVEWQTRCTQGINSGWKWHALSRLKEELQQCDYLYRCMHREFWAVSDKPKGSSCCHQK
jgi:hypothetical protein